MWKEKILLVDDERNVLSGFKRQLRNHFHTETGLGGEAGLEAIDEKGPFGVVVSDMRMPGMDGIEFLKKVRKVSPDTVRIMLTGNADQETAIRAVNEGNIFRFLTKPCQEGLLVRTLAGGIRQHRLITAEKELLSKTLQGSIKVLTEILSLTDTEIFDQATKVRDRVEKMAKILDLENVWEIEAAAMLSPIGFVVLPPELKEKIRTGGQLSTEEAKMRDEAPEIGHRLLSNIPRLESVALIVSHIKTRLIGSSTEIIEDDQDDVSMASRLLSTLSDLVEIESTGKTIVEALVALRQKTGQYDPRILAAAEEAFGGDQELGTGRAALLETKVNGIMVGDILRSDVVTDDQRRLLASGTRITSAFLERINRYYRLVGIEEPIQVIRWTSK